MSFTVAIPTFNRRETVVLAVRSALAQSHGPESVVVLCDGCTDGTVEALGALGDDRLDVVDLPKGEGYAYGYRNLAMERGTGEIVTWLADDDLLLPDHLERLQARWDRGDVDLVTAPAVIVDPDDALTWIGRDWSVPVFREWLERENGNVMASVAIRAALATEIGGWDATVPRAADWELWRRAMRAGARAAMVDEPTVLHFKATGREQDWTARVAQNEAWFARLGDPVALAELRLALRRARSEAEARAWAELQTANAGWREANEGSEGLAAEVGRLAGELEETHRHHAVLVEAFERTTSEHERYVESVRRHGGDA